MANASKEGPELRERDHAILSQVHFIETLRLTSCRDSHSSRERVHLVSAEDTSSVSIDAFKGESDGVSKCVDRAVESSLCFVREAHSLVVAALTRCKVFDRIRVHVHGTFHWLDATHVAATSIVRCVSH